MSFKEEFKKVLNGRTDFIDTVNKVITKYENNKFGFEIVEQIGYEDTDENMTEEEFDNFVPREYPGYMIFIIDRGEPIQGAYGGKPQVYKYMLIDAELPMESDRQFPVKFTLCNLNGKKNYITASVDQLVADLELIFNSTQFTNIIKKIEEMLDIHRTK